MQDSIVIEPPLYHTITHVLPLRTDDRFEADYDKYVEACRATYTYVC